MIRPWHLRWGAAKRTWPGDDMIPTPLYVSARALNVRPPARRVGPGQGRGVRVMSVEPEWLLVLAGSMRGPPARRVRRRMAEPAHLIVERGMLLGIKARAERMRGDEGEKLL